MGQFDYYKQTTAGALPKGGSYGILSGPINQQFEEAKKRREAKKASGYVGGGGPHDMGGGNAYQPGPSTYAPPTPPAPPANPYGSQSGPGYLADRYINRANGTDAAYEYALKRGGDSIDARMAAGGSYNSGARGQQLSDYYANMTAQSQAQLDALAAGASGEHANQVNSSIMQNLGLANGMAGMATAYDLGAAGNMAAANQAQQQMFLNKAGVDAQGNQGAINNVVGGFRAIYGGGGGQTR